MNSCQRGSPPDIGVVFRLRSNVKGIPFQLWTLTVTEENTAILTCREDCDMPVIYEERDDTPIFRSGPGRCILSTACSWSPPRPEGTRLSARGNTGDTGKNVSPFLEWQRACGGGCTGQRKGFSYGSGKRWPKQRSC